MSYMLCCCLCMFASVTIELIPSHRSLAFRTSTTQKNYGENIERVFGLTSRARTRLAVRDPEGSIYTLKHNFTDKIPISCSINVMNNRLWEFMAYKDKIIMKFYKIFKCLKLSCYFSFYDCQKMAFQKIQF